MNFLQHLSIRVRLFLLTGVPVVGALVLAAMIALFARGTRLVSAFATSARALEPQPLRHAS